MVDLEENKRNLIYMKNKLEEIGGSLWHPIFREEIKWIREENYSRWFLDESKRI